MAIVTIIIVIIIKELLFVGARLPLKELLVKKILYGILEGI